MLFTSGQGLALLRIGFGLYLIASAWDKTAKGWLTSGAPLRGTLFGNPNATPPTAGAVGNPQGHDFYKAFLTDVVQPNVDLFAQLVTVGEWVAGISLLLGLFTALGSFVTILLTTNYMLMKGFVNMSANSDRLFILAGIAFGLAAAGLVWGLDGRFRHLFASNPLTRLLSGIPRLRSYYEPAPGYTPAPEYERDRQLTGTR